MGIFSFTALMELCHEIFCIVNILVNNKKYLKIEFYFEINFIDTLNLLGHFYHSNYHKE